MNQEKIFAVGDIHGCAAELEELIDKLPLDPYSKIVFLGDYVDRGPQSNQVIEFIIQLSKRYQVIPLMGNHESMMLEFFKDPSAPLAGYFILNGGSATLASYVSQGNDYVVPDHHFEFLNSLPLFFETDTHFFVHAGVPNIELSQLDAQKHRHDLLWLRTSFHQSQFNWGKIIVHGHTPTPTVEQTDRRINLDTGCVFNNFLTAMETVSGQIFQVAAQKRIPHTFLKENPQVSRVAKRFLGAIPVFVETETGYEEFMTINYNEFGLLIVDVSGGERIFKVGQTLKGKIGDLTKIQIEFTGQVVRHQKRGHDIAYGIKMIKPLGHDYKV